MPSNATLLIAMHTVPRPGVFYLSRSLRNLKRELDSFSALMRQLRGVQPPSSCTCPCLSALVGVGDASHCCFMDEVDCVGGRRLLCFAEGGKLQQRLQLMQ